MDAFYTSILDLLNGFLPTAQQATFGNFNEFLAYVLTIGLIWAVLLRPLLKILRVVK